MAYLYEVGPGKTYATVTLAHAAVVTDWGTGEFDAPVEIRIYDDTYTEALDLTCTLNPTVLNPLRIYAASGNDSVIWDGSGNAYCLRALTNSNLNRLHIKGIQFSGASIQQLYMKYVDQVIVEDCKLTDANYEVFYARYGYLMTFINCELDSGSDNFGYVNQHTNYIKCVITFGNTQALAYPTEFRGCIIDGSDLLATEDMLTFNSYFPIDMRNCVFKGGKRAIVAGTTGVSVATSAEIMNCIFTGQDVGAIDLSGQRFYHTVIEANDYYDCGYAVKDVDGTYSSLVDLRAAGYDTLEKSIATDPVLDAPFTGKIGAASPCIEAGIGAGVLTDYWGESFSQIYDLPSIGADAQHDSDDAPSLPSEPTWNGSLIVGDTTLTVPIAAAAETDVVYVRHRQHGADWEDENETDKRTGSGNVAIAGLTNDRRYWVSFYAKSGSATSDWAQPKSAIPNDGAPEGAVKTLKGIVKAKLEALLSAHSITVYAGLKDPDARFPFAIMDLMLDPAGGQHDVSGYTIDLTVKVYARPLRTSTDTIDDYLDLLERGMHGHTEESASDHWHWQSTQMLSRQAVVENRNVRMGIVSFQLSVKEVEV